MGGGGCWGGGDSERCCPSRPAQHTLGCYADIGALLATSWESKAVFECHRSRLGPAAHDRAAELLLRLSRCSTAHGGAKAWWEFDLHFVGARRQPLPRLGQWVETSPLATV